MTKDSIGSRMELLDRMRGRWERRVTPTVEAVYSYTEGYADAGGLGFDSTWEDISEWVHNYLSIKKEVQWDWTSQLSRHAPCYACEIPMLYAAIDHGRGFKYQSVQSWEPDECWRSAFEAREKAFSGLRPEMARPAPKRVVLGRASDDVWRMFLVDDRGLRYWELARKSDADSKLWASSKDFLGVPVDSWRHVESESVI